MKNYNLYTPEGVKDLLWEDAILKNKIAQHILKLFSQYSYHLIETPTFEYLDVFTLAENQLQNPHLYQFVNKQGELLALRNDMTCAIARVVATQNSSLPLPQRYCYIANSFRYPERFQGKSHEFTQAGVELIGHDSVESDAEVIKLALQSIETSGIEGMTLHLGNASFLQNLLEDIGLTGEEQSQIYHAIDNKDGVKVKQLLETAKVSQQVVEVISYLIQRTGSIELLQKVKAAIKGERTKVSLEYLERLYKVLADYGISDKIQFDFSVLSYASYYTGIMFQVFLPNVGSAVVEGGRYNKLLSKYGKDLPAVGFGVNLDLLLQKVQQQTERASINAQSTLIIYTPETRRLGLQFATHFRKQGMVVENYLDYTIEEAITYAQGAQIGGILYFQSNDTVAVYDMTSEAPQYLDPMTLL
ncbi:MAG: ATP phosphoribosyltransferase regulatory subunit [Cellulosilyticaceae bacterium]